MLLADANAISDKDVKEVIARMECLRTSAGKFIEHMIKQNRKLASSLIEMLRATCGLPRPATGRSESIQPHALSIRRTDDL